MEDFFEKKIKEFLKYIIIIAAVYLLLPAVMVLTKSSVVFNQIVYIGIFPLVALLCSAHYAYTKKTDFFITLIAPVIYIPSMLLYGNLRDSVINSLIFLVAYFICGYLGLTLGEMFKEKNDSETEKEADAKNSTARVTQKPKAQMRNRVPKRVEPRKHISKTRDDSVFEDIEMPQKFEAVEPVAEKPIESFTQSSEDDIDAILAEIHGRREL